MTVREELQYTTRSKAAAGPGTGIATEAKEALQTYIMDQVEKLVWRKFDEFKASGRFKVKVMFFSVDAAGIVEHFLAQAIGPRPLVA